MKILYEDSHMIVCYKEAGLPVQSARIGTRDLENILKNYLSEKTGKAPYLAVVHRLDQPVEGVLVFAKTQKAAASLSAQVNDGRMKKIYHAVVSLEENTDMILEQDWTTLCNYMLKDGKTNTSRIVSANTKGAKKAELEYRILKTTEIMKEEDEKKTMGALAEIHLHTGRHHQIRVQMAGAEMPLFGDRKYGKETLCEYGKSLALCAVSLELVHPGNGKKMQFTCEPQGEYFKLF